MPRKWRQLMVKGEQVLEQLRALAPAERARVVDWVIREGAADVTPRRFPGGSIWSDESDVDSTRSAAMCRG